MNLTLSERLMYSTVRIESILEGGLTSTGTGFFFNFLIKEDNTYIPTIVTNKHVIEGAIAGKVQITMANDKNEPEHSKHWTLEIGGFSERWLMHPGHEVDLCVMPIALILEKAKEENIKLFYIPMEKSITATNEYMEELTSMEDIVMVGYPNGIWDEINNLPIMRKGVTATHPKFDYNGKKEFMIDAACFPGSSGSPVVLLNEGSYANRDGSLMAGNRIKLLGVLYAGPQHTTEGTIIIKNIAVRNEPVALSRIPNNLGVVIKAEKLMEFEKIFENNLVLN